MTGRAWIHVIDETLAKGRLARLYRRYIDSGTGQVDNILKIHSLRPASLEAHHRLYRTILHGPGPLSPRHREIIAVVVSSANSCHY